MAAEVLFIGTLSTKINLPTCDTQQTRVHVSKSVTVTQSLMGLPRPRGPGYRSKTYPCASGLANDARGSQFKLVDAWTRTDMVRILRLIHNPARGTKLQVAFSRGDRDREGKRPGGSWRGVCMFRHEGERDVAEWRLW